MGLFKKTKSRGPSSLPDEQIDIPTQSQKKSKKKWFSKKNKSNKHNEEYDDQVPLQAVDTIEKQQYPTQQLNNVIVSEERGDTPLLNQYNNTSHMNNDYEDASIGDIPRSISTPSRDMGNELPPLPATPNDLAQCCGMNNVILSGYGGVEEDSIGSPCDAMFKKNQQQKQQQKQVVDKLRTLTIVPTDEANNEQNKIKNQATIDKLQTIITPEATPSIDHLAYYIQALSASISPNPSGDLPARALRSLFTLSELSTNKQQRIDMVRGSPTDKDKEASLIPALLNFLQRCPRDSSEQYLTLLVLNNLSIPNENKRTIALQYDGVATLGKLLCEDPGCHLLVIIIVNLTFGDESLNRDILESKGTGEDGEESGVQLVESISYALLLATLTTEQLATLGPVPLSNEEGDPYSPSKLLTLLFTMLESKLQLKYHRSHLKGNHENDNLMLLPPISLGDNEEEYPFAETARWCLGALKNLTRSSKLSPTSVTSSDEDKLKVGVLTTKDTAASTVASQAILDSGILTLLLRIIKNKSYDDAGTVYNWEANSAQDAALYTLLHMSSVPEIREVLRLDYECVEVLTGILNYGKAIVGEKTLVTDEEGESMGQLSLQCLKARLAMSYLVLGQENSSEKSKYGPSTTIAEHEAHSLIELLSHCLHSRAKEGTGGYSSATFSLKFVLYGIECILSEPANRKLFASTGNASRLNTLLLKAVSLTILNSDLMDSEAAENALQSIYQMTLYGLNEDELGYSITCGQAIFLPANLGDDGHDFEAKGVVTRVLRSYLSSQNDEITLKARNAANQIMFRLNYLRFDGSVADLVSLHMFICVLYFLYTNTHFEPCLFVKHRHTLVRHIQPNQTMSWTARYSQSLTCYMILKGRERSQKNTSSRVPLFERRKKEVNLKYTLMYLPPQKNLH